jgi:adenosyl cobinamide kinase/adenosyl cobinamide phosphate guanylyltransferase
MHLILGGAYQGKTGYAKERFGLSDADIHICGGAEVSASARAVSHLERFTRACVEAGRDPLDAWAARAPRAEVLLCDDIFCGVVPLDPLERLWREQTGRFLAALAAEAETVTKVFCGLPLELKP